MGSQNKNILEYFNILPYSINILTPRIYILEIHFSYEY